MQCKQCNTEMMIDKVYYDTDEGTETFSYKCPNPVCTNYGYKKEGE